jgi:hypothetical protein
MPKNNPPQKPAPRVRASRPAPVPPPSRLTRPGIPVSDPQFGETKYTPDPTQFLTAVTDAQYYKLVDKETASR